VAVLLVVDDEQDIRDLLVKRLVREGHEVLPAASGAAAMALLQEHSPPDAAVLDVDMPGMDGFDLLLRLRASHPGLPALFLTVLWDAEVRTRIAAAGGVYVAKPFTAAALAAGVRQMLGDHPGGTR
jgi:two-component system, OmpR family, response regulator